MVKKFSREQSITFTKEYVKRLRKDGLPIVKAYLFGSYARGDQRDWSDIDIAIITPRFETRFDAHNYLWDKRTEEDVLRRIEPIGIRPDNFVDESPIAYWIKREGIEIDA